MTYFETYYSLFEDEKIFLDSAFPLTGPLQYTVMSVNAVKTQQTAGLPLLIIDSSNECFSPDGQRTIIEWNQITSVNCARFCFLSRRRPVGVSAVLTPRFLPRDRILSVKPRQGLSASLNVVWFMGWPFWYCFNSSTCALARSTDERVALPPGIV
jgi:hypothetical protein